MFGAMFAYVFVRAFQQRNVAFAHYWWVVPTSLVMAVFDVFIITFVAHQGWSVAIVLANGGGGALGCLSAIYLHKRWVKNV
jgi:hypothetical protein